MNDPMNTNEWHTHHDRYLSEEPLDRKCADCGAHWTKSSDGLSAHMVHEPDCAWMAWLLEQDQGREWIEWMCSEDEDLGAMLEDYDRWMAAMRLHTEYLGEWCVRCNAHRIVVDSGSNSGFAGEGLSWYTLACGHSEVEEGNILAAIL